MHRNNIIKRIEIDDFRSLHKVIIEPSPITGFMWLNDVGKSNALKALNLFFNNQTDFLINFNFSSDFCKFWLASSQIAAKKKQQIKIKIYLNPPENYTSFTKKEDIYIEKIYSRDSNIPRLVFSHEWWKIWRSLSTLYWRLRYVYIPALKWPDVLKHLIGLVWWLNILDSSKIDELNNHIKDKTKDLSKLIIDSKIPISAEFWLPSTLEEFWQNLNANTLVDNFKELPNLVKKTAKSTKKKLEERDYLIPLSNRWDWIKSKYIPPLLKWIEEQQKGKIYIWWIDEPENSLEFNAAEDVAKLYYNSYAESNQIFFTSHSLAFLNPWEDNKYAPKLYLCYKNGSYTELETPDTLLSNMNRQELFERMWILEVQKRVMTQFREEIAVLNKEKENLKEINKRLNNAFPPKVFICEDSNPRTIKLWGIIFEKYGIPDIQVFPSGWCMTDSQEDAFFHKKNYDGQNNYDPKIIRQVDRWWLNDDHVNLLKQQKEKKYRWLKYKFLALPVYEIENFAVLIDNIIFHDIWNNNEKKISNDTNAELFSRLKEIQKIPDNWIKNLDFGYTVKYSKILDNNPLKYHAWKCFVSLKNNYNWHNTIINCDIENRPTELKEYLDEIKSFFNN